MKAIIIAAGMGSRLGSLNKDGPKCMLELDGRTILQHQISALRSAGIEKVALIKGYKQERINYSDLVYYLNDNYQKNNILFSLFYAEEEMDAGFIALYSDIIFEKDIIQDLLKSEHDISIVVDTNWKQAYIDRAAHPIDEAEAVIFDAHRNLVKIGKILPDKNSASGEFIGMMKCSKKGAAIFKNHFKRIKKFCLGKPFQSAKVFENAYLTDMLQDLTDSGIKIHCVAVNGGWKEIDTPEDYQKARECFT